MTLPVPMLKATRHTKIRYLDEGIAIPKRVRELTEAELEQLVAVLTAELHERARAQTYALMAAPPAVTG